MKNFFLKRTLLQLASMGFLFVLLLAPTRIYMTGLISLDFSPSFMSDIFISVIDVLLVFLLGFILYKNKDKITKPNLIAIIMASVIGALLLQSFVTLLIVDNFTFNYFLSSVSKLTRFLLMVGFVVSLIKFKILSLEDFEIILVLSIMILVLVSPISMIVFEIYGKGIGRAGTLGFPPNYLGVLGSVLFVYGFFTKKLYVRIPSWIIGLTGAILSGSRRPLYFLVAFLVVYLIYEAFIKMRLFIKEHNKQGIRKYIISVSSFILFIALFVVLWDTRALDFFKSLPLIKRLISFQENGQNPIVDNARMEIYKKVWNIIKHHPFGLGGSDAYLNVVYLEEGHAHNVFFQAALLYGWVWVVAFFGLFVYYGIRFVKSIFNYSVKGESVGIFNFYLMILIVYDLLDYNLYSSKMMYVFALMFALVFIKYTNQKNLEHEVVKE
jgi:hypothetical protein